MNKSVLTLLTVTAIGKDKVPYQVNVAAGEERIAEKTCQRLNDFIMKQCGGAETGLLPILQNKAKKAELMADLDTVLMKAQAKRVFKALEQVCISHRVDLGHNIFDTKPLTAI